MEAILGLLFIVLFIAAWAALFAKAGFSPWLSLLMIVPIANLVMLFIFIVGEWPIQREIRNNRIRWGLGTEEDAYSLLGEAVKHEVKGDIENALLKYGEVVVRFRNTVAGKDAQIAIDSLKSKSEPAMNDGKK
jgi:hypothetical protein